MKLITYIIVFFVVSLQITNGQYGVGVLYEELPNDSISTNTIDLHTNFKPFIRQNNFTSWKKGVEPKQNYFFIAPAVDLIADFYNQLNYRTGLGFSINANAGKWFFHLGALGGAQTSTGLFNTRSYYFENIGTTDFYADIRGRVSYTPNEIFNFQVGLDNHFIGEGSRSLFLSDYGTPFPFAQIRTKFWRVEYTVLYQFMREHIAGNWNAKFATSHHISFNLAKWLNLGIFETVLFQPKDTLLNRGYEAEYLNPIIFLRPQEYSLGSSDNVLIGLSLDAKFGKHTIYTQGILDEFNLAEVKNHPSWWANKYGAQIGFKGRQHLQLGNLFYRIEYNFLRPFVYSHIGAMQNYGNQGYALAYPVGANFHELVAEVKWQKHKFLVKLFTTYRLQGLDEDGYNYGADIYESYVNRIEDYGFYVGRGLRNNISKTIITLDYELWKAGKIHAYFESHFVYNSFIKKMNYYPVVGIRSQLWNDYRNY